MRVKFSPPVQPLYPKLPSFRSSAPSPAPQTSHFRTLSSLKKFKKNVLGVKEDRFVLFLDKELPLETCNKLTDFAKNNKISIASILVTTNQQKWDFSSYTKGQFPALTVFHPNWMGREKGLRNIPIFTISLPKTFEDLVNILNGLLVSL